MHEPLTADPDVEQAIEDLRETVERMRAHSATAVRLPTDSPAQIAEQREVKHLFEFVELRAQRLHDISADGLLALVNADLDSRSRRGRPEPARPTKRTLLTALTNAEAEETTALRQLTAAQTVLAQAQRKRRAAEEAYQAVVSGRGA